MSKIKQLISQAGTLPHCCVLEPAGLPKIVEIKHILSDDIFEFYSLCGGLVLFEDKDYPIYVVSPDKFVLANPMIVGELCKEDISSNWYIICNDGKDEYLTIDLGKRQVREML
jgi:antitoxin YokJ